MSLSFFRKPICRYLYVFLAIQMLLQSIWPATAWALTSGPSQPEVQSFEPVGTSDMVDLFTGDFTYNIPLFDLEGYPINLAYQGGVSMDQEASWVGLGWNINPGAIVRNIRGIPDDFNGDIVREFTTMKPNETWGLSIDSEDLELFGIKLNNDKIKKTLGDSLDVTLDLSFGIKYNNYRGLGLSVGLNPGMQLLREATLNDGNKIDNSLMDGKTKTKDTFLFGGSLSLNFDNYEGMSASLHLRHRKSSVAQIGGSINSRSGLRSLSIGKLNNNISAYSYFPSSPISYLNTSYTFNGAIGPEVTFLQVGVGFNGFYLSQGILQKQRFNPAYGYNHLGSVHTADALLDFNREKLAAFTRSRPNLPLPTLTYDNYSITGQGIGGTVRPVRNDMGYAYSPASTSVTINQSGGVEIGAIELFKGGANVTGAYTIGYSGNWKGNHPAHNTLQYHNGGHLSGEGKAEYEPYYFRIIGEPVYSPNRLFDDYAGEEPVEVAIERGAPYQVKARSEFQNESTSSSGNSSVLNRSRYPIGLTATLARTPRTQLFSQLTASEAALHAQQPQLTYFTKDTQGALQTNLLQRVTTQRKPHHLSEITVHKPDGWRYVYGLPAYNTRHEEYSFAINSNNDGSCHTGLVSYTGDELSEENNSGIDQYFNRKEIPPYAHSYLLTSVVSPDYVDVTQNGSTEDDLGSAITFSYLLATNQYKWRTPYGISTEQANYEEGLQSNPHDDRASLLYGEKEIWYLQRMDSRNQVAIFYLSERLDSRGAKDVDGGIDTDPANSMLKLDSIRVFSKVDYTTRGETATPIKSIHFDYDYSLCPRIENFYDPTQTVQPGKLTLKRVYFTYGTSRKAQLNGYTFHYADMDHDRQMDQLNGEFVYNPSYNIRGYDRWGNYKPNATHCGVTASGLSNVYDPYVSQQIIPQGDPLFDPARPWLTYADIYAAAWSLTKIDLPSGGSINVHYEADDYAYVQDKQAMQMYRLEGFNTAPEVAGATSRLYNQGDHPGYLIFKLDNPVDPSQKEEVEHNIMADVINKYGGKVYFKTLVKITENGYEWGGGRQPAYEYVEGYATITGFHGLLQSTISGPYTHGCLQLRKENLTDNPLSSKVNPITLAALQFARYAMPDLVYSGSNPKTTGESAIKGLLVSLGELANMIAGPNAMLVARQFAQSILPEKSFIRLGVPSGAKKGGGSRVTRIELADNWAEMVTPQHGATSMYGQEYDYTMPSPSHNAGAISSGVAQYEPMIGGEENPWRQPVSYTDKVLLSPNKENYVETPLGESLFPGASVGYRSVTVRNLSHPQVTSGATGKVVHEFYTAYDFPVFVGETNVDPIHQRNEPISTYFFQSTQRAVSASQGYVIQLNDMHGKPKGQSTYGEAQEGVISSVRYIYQTDPVQPNKLSNTVQVIDASGSIRQDTLGMDIEMVTDFHEMTDAGFSAGLQANIDASLVGIPIPVPTGFPDASWNYDRFSSVVTTKVINRYGILQQVIAKDFASEIATSNELYDAETGQVVLTRTTNEFNDDVYNFNYPAYWAYPAMGGAYTNTGATHGPVSITNGYADFQVMGYQSMLSEHFMTGDEIMLLQGNQPTPDKYWIAGIDETNKRILLVDSKGALIDNHTDVQLKIIRSGRRNLQSLSVGSLTTMSDPRHTPIPMMDSIVSSSAVQYHDDWHMACDCNCRDTVVVKPPVIPDPTPICLIDCKDDVELIGQFAQIMNLLIRNKQLITNNPVKMGKGTAYSLYDKRMRSYLTPTNGQHTWAATTNGMELQGAFATFKNYCPVTISVEGGLPSCCTYESFWATLKTIYDLQVLPVDPSGKCEDFVATELTATALFEGTCTIPSLMAGCTNTFREERTITIKTNCYPFAKCTATLSSSGTVDPDPTVQYDTITLCNDGVGSIVNPYLTGRKGIWRQSSAQVYNTHRTYQGYTRYDGLINEFQPFWEWSSGQLQPSGSNNWIQQQTVTKYHPIGTEVENLDPLGNYSSAVFGYNQSLPVAVAGNARYHDIAFDGFEDYDFYTANDCANGHFNFAPQADLVHTAHTGMYSLRLRPDAAVSVVRPLNQPNALPGSLPITAFPYRVQPEDCIGVFGPTTSPTNDRQFLISYWTAMDIMPEDFLLREAALTATVDGLPISLQEFTRTQVVEGWQRVEMLLTLPPNTNGDLTLTFRHSGQTAGYAYIDDVRIHPFNSNMKSYVYDPVTLRLSAELDENNFATFYEYNQEGKLIRIKKETADGIVTLQETRENLRKRP